MYVIPNRAEEGLEMVEVIRTGTEVRVLWSDGWGTVYRYSPDNTVNLIRYLPPHRYQKLELDRVYPPKPKAKVLAIEGIVR